MTIFGMTIFGFILFVIFCIAMISFFNRILKASFGIDKWNELWSK